MSTKTTSETKKSYVQATVRCRGGFSSPRGTHSVSHAAERDVEGGILEAARCISDLLSEAKAKMKGDEVILWERVELRHVIPAADCEAC